MQKHLLLLSAVVIVAIAAPKPYYREHYKYEQQSESFKNNELQHKTEEAGRYAKIEDGTSAPIERSSFHQAEYHAPGADDDGTKASLSLTGGPDTQRYQKSSSFRREWSSQGGGVVGGDSDHSSLGYGQNLHGTAGIASQSLTSAASESQNRRYFQSGQGVVQETPVPIPTSYRREWNQQSVQSNQGSTHPGRGHAYGHQIGRGNPHRVHGYDDSQTIDSTASLSSVSQTISQQKEETGFVAQHNQETDQPHGSTHPGRGHAYGHQIGRGNPHRVHGYDDSQTIDSTASQSSVSQTISQQKEETGYVAQHNQETDQPHGNGRGRGHGHGRGRGHSEHGRGHGYGHQKYDQEYGQTSEYAYRYPDNTNTQTDQVSSTSGTGNIYHSTGTNTASNTGSVYYKSGTNSASQTRLTGTDTNRQPNDDTTGIYGTVPQKPSGVLLVPSTSGTGTVTHRTSRTYSTQSKVSGISTIPQNSDTQINRNYGGTSRVHLQPVIVSNPINSGYIRHTPKLQTTTENIRSVYEQPEPEVDQPSSDAQSIDVVHRRLRPVQPTINKQTTHQSSYQTSGFTRQTNTQQNTEDLTKQNEEDSDEFQDITHQTHDQQQTDLTRSLTQQTEDEFDDQQTQHGFDDLTQQSEHSFDHSTQQIQNGYKIIPITQQNNQKPSDTTPILKDYPYTPIISQTNNQKTDSNTPKINPGSYSHHRTYQTQRVEKTEFAEQPIETVTQEPQTTSQDYWRRTPYQNQQGNQQHRDVPQQTPTGYRNNDKQHGYDQQSEEDLTQQHEDVFDQQHEDQTQQHEEGHFEFSSQQSQNKFEKVPHVEQNITPKTTYQQPQYQKPQHEDQTQHQGHFEFSSQSQNKFEKVAHVEQDITPQTTYQQPQYGTGKIINFSQQNKDLTQQSQTGFGSNNNNYEDLSPKTHNLGTTTNTNGNHGSSYSSSSSYSASKAYSAQQQQPQVVYSPIRVGSQKGNLQVYQTMQIPAGASQEEIQRLQEQLTQRLKQKMQELQSQQQSSQRLTFSPVHIGTQSGTGQLEVYQTMQVPSGTSQELRLKMEEQLRQLGQKMQQGEYYQRSTGPISVQTYSSGAGFGADCDEQTGGFVSSSYTSSGAVGGNHYAMKLRPSSTVTTSGSSYSMSQQMQHQPVHLFTHKGY